MARLRGVKPRAGPWRWLRAWLPPAVGVDGWLKWCSARGAPGVSAALPGVCGEVSVGAGAGCGVGGCRRDRRCSALGVVFGPYTVVCGARRVSGWVFVSMLLFLGSCFLLSSEHAFGVVDSASVLQCL